MVTMNKLLNDAVDALETEVKIEDLEHENIELTIAYKGGQACLTGRVTCFDTYCWIGHAHNGLTLPLGTILERRAVGGRDDYIEGYKFHATMT